MRTFVPVLVTALALVALVGCGNDAAAPTGFAPGQTTEAYAYVHGGYVGKATVTTDDEGSIDATLDEAFLPHTLAVVDMESDEWNEDNTAFYVSHGRESRVAKWISYDGTNYTGVTVGTAVVYVESDEEGNPAGGATLEKSIIRNEANMAAYWDGIGNGAFQVYTEFGGSGSTVSTTSYGSLYKRGSSYWADRGKTWEGNMEAIQEAAEQYGVGYALDEMTQNNDNEWQLADATTGATASDFRDYFSMIQLAVARLEME